MSQRIRSGGSTRRSTVASARVPSSWGSISRVAFGAILLTGVLIGLVNPEPLLPIAIATVAIGTTAWHGWAVRRHASLLDSGGSSYVEAFQSEIGRARRYDRPLSIVVVEPDEGDDRYQVAADLRLRLRAVDRVFVEGNRVLALVPETGETQAARLVRRAVAPGDQVSAGMVAAYATLPADGYTAERIHDVAEARLAREGVRSHRSR